MENKRIFRLLGYEAPSKKIILEKYDRGIFLRYIAVKTKELLNIYSGEDLIGSIQSRKMIDVPTGEEYRKVYVAGQWEAYKAYMGMGLPKQEPPTTYEEQGFIVNPFAKDRVEKDKSLTYTELKEINKGKYNEKVYGTSVEDYLYRTRDLQEVLEEKGLNLDWVKEKDYRILRTREELIDFIEALAKLDPDEVVGFDVETSGLNVNSSRLDKLVGICMSYEDHTGVYIPIAHERIANIQMTKDEFLGYLKPYIDRRSEKALQLVTHNGNFDAKAMLMENIYLNIVHDTFYQYGLLYIAEAKKMMGLKPMVSMKLGIDVIELSDMYENRTQAEVEALQDAVINHDIRVNDVTKNKLLTNENWKDTLRYDFRFASEEFVKIYGGADGDFPRLMYKQMLSEWDNSLDQVYQIEIGVIPAVAEQEFYGVKAESKNFEKLYEEAKLQQAQLEREIYALAGKEFNIGSPKQKQQIIFEEMGCPILPRFRTRKGGVSTNAETLSTLASYKNDDGSQKYPIIPLIQKYTKVTTLIKNFYGKLPKLIRKDHLYPTYSQLGTETGRFSCSNPNLQQTEKTSRQYMTVDDENYYFLVCDYSQVEYRLMAGLSGEKKVIDFFRDNPEADYHIMAVSNMMGIPYEDVTGEMRKLGKVLNFGTTYGLGDEQLALKLYGNTTELHQMKARQARKEYFDGIPILRDYFEAERDKAQERKFAITKFGRKRYISDFVSYNNQPVPKNRIESGRRKAGNMPVQGTAADIQKMALTRIYHGFKALGFYEDKARIVMNIHDEIVMHIHKSINPWYALKIMREAMEMDFSDEGFPPLYVGGNVGYTWLDGKEDDLEAPVMLMNEKIAEVDAFLAKGHTYDELPYIEDPKQMWLDEIDKFALRQVEYEQKKNGYTNLQTMTSNGRLMKYAGRFKNMGLIIKSVYEQGWEATYADLHEITSVAKEDYYEIVQEEEMKQYGKELRENTESLDTYISKIFKRKRTGKGILINCDMIDNDVLEVLNNLVVHDDDLELYSNEMVALAEPIYVKFGTGAIEKLLNVQLMPPYLEYLTQLIKRRLTGEQNINYRQEQEELDARLINVH